MGNCIRKQIGFFLLFLLLSASFAMAETKCVDAEGEAVIVQDDLPSAKAEAIARAKWAAVEQAVGIEVKAQSIVQNMALVDEAISKQISGSVSSFRLLSQNPADGVMRVRIHACIEPAMARDTVAGLALNNAISVFLLVKEPSGWAGRYKESNILSESLIGKLAGQGYTVTDIAASRALDENSIDSAIRSGKILGLRSLMSRFLTNILLIGKVECSLSNRKGGDTGYGFSMPFNAVRAQLTYRLITKNEAGEMIILAAGIGEGRGLANAVTDATAESLKDLAEKVTPEILEKVGQHIKGVARRVEVRVTGITELRDNFEIKEILQNIAWVTDVEERGLGEFTVRYPENVAYLANSISQKKHFRVESFTQNQIRLSYAGSRQK